jgi:hypothetical protein
MSTHHAGGQQAVPIRPSLRAAPHAEEQGLAARLRRLLARILPGPRIRFRAAVKSLVIEQLITGGTRAAITISHAENLILALGKAAGDQILQKTQGVLDALAKKSDGLRAAQAALRIRALYRDGDIIPYPDGGVQTVIDTAAEQDRVRDQVSEDTSRGSYRHRRLPAILRRVPMVVFCCDGLLLLYFFSGITDVDWSSPFSSTPALVFAVLLAAMVTGISFAFFRFTGDRLQQYKDDTGTVPLRGLDMGTNVSMGLSGGAMLVLATLMFTRMNAEVILSLGPNSDFTATIVGLTLAVVGILANTLVIAVHALDGSTETDRLDALGAAVGPALAAQHQLLEQADALDPVIAVTIREAERTAHAGITAAGYERATAERTIDAGRAAHQGAGPFCEPAVDPNDQDGVIGYRRPDATPKADERPIHHTLGQLSTPLADGSGTERHAA